MAFGYRRKQPHTKPLITQCAICGNDLHPSKQGRAKRYCSDKCRKEAQRRRENGDKANQEATAERKLRTRYLKFSAQVVEKLEQIKNTYGVFAAWEASEALMLLLIADKSVTEQQSQNTSDQAQDTGAYPLKAWLRDRLKQGKRDAIDALAKRMIDDKRLPTHGSRSLYIAHMRAKAEYTLEDIATFNQAWQEMRDQT